MESEKHIYLVRHGRSRANETRIVEGGESPLVEAGRNQAEIVAERFKDIPIELVLSSHFVRAQDTGRKIAENKNLPFEVVGMAFESEISTKVHGLHYEDPLVKDAIENRNKSWINNIPEEGEESFEVALKRVMDLSAVLENRSEKHIAVTSHGFFLKLFVAHHILGKYLTAESFLCGMNASMRSTNTGLTYFTLDTESKWTLRSWNDSAHLGELHT